MRRVCVMTHRGVVRALNEDAAALPHQPTGRTLTAAHGDA